MKKSISLRVSLITPCHVINCILVPRITGKRLVNPKRVLTRVPLQIFMRYRTDSRLILVLFIGPLPLTSDFILEIILIYQFYSIRITSGWTNVFYDVAS